MKKVSRDVGALYQYDTMLFEIHVIYECMYICYMLMKEVNDSSDVCIILECAKSGSGVIAMTYVYISLIIYLVVQCCMVVWLLYYILYTLECYVYDETFLFFIYFESTTLKPTLNHHSLSYTHFVVP